MAGRSVIGRRRALGVLGGSGAGLVTGGLAFGTSATQQVLSASVVDAATPGASETEAETWIHSLALQAAAYGVPLVAMYLLRNTVSFGTRPKAPPNEIWRLSDIATPAVAQQSGYVTPNVNVVYGYGFMDLGRQPVILSVPDSHGRYYMVQLVDMRTNSFAYAGGTATGYKGGVFALVGPGWQGTLPPGATRINCPTRWVELQPRVHVKDEADLPGARAVLNAITVKGLAQAMGGSAPAPVAYHYEVPKINSKVASSLMQFQDPLQFWSIFSAAMNENRPPDSEIKAVLPQFRRLGIELGKQWTRESVSLLILAQMKHAAAEIGPMLDKAAAGVATVANGWVIPPANLGKAGTDYPSRAMVAVGGLTANAVEEAIYYDGLRDANGRPLIGARRYTITFMEPRPYIATIPPGFWSITMYDAVTHFTVPNRINRYSLGSDDTLKHNTDGSFTVYVQHVSPGADKESNWLPAPLGPFYLVLRSYAPAPAVVKALNNPAHFQGPPPVLPL